MKETPRTVALVLRAQDGHSQLAFLTWQDGFGYCVEIEPVYPANYTEYRVATDNATNTTSITAVPITDICGYRYEGTSSCEDPFVEDTPGWCCYRHFYMYTASYSWAIQIITGSGGTDFNEGVGAAPHAAATHPTDAGRPFTPSRCCGDVTPKLLRGVPS